MQLGHYSIHYPKNSTSFLYIALPSCRDSIARDLHSAFRYRALSSAKRSVYKDSKTSSIRASPLLVWFLSFAHLLSRCRLRFLTTAWLCDRSISDEPTTARSICANRIKRALHRPMSLDVLVMFTSCRCRFMCPCEAFVPSGDGSLDVLVITGSNQS